VSCSAGDCLVFDDRLLHRGLLACLLVISVVCYADPALRRSSSPQL